MPDFVPSFDKKTTSPEKPFPMNTVIAGAGAFLLILTGAAVYFFLLKDTRTETTVSPQERGEQDAGKYGFAEDEPYTVERGLEIERNRYERFKEDEAVGKFNPTEKSASEIAAEKGEVYVPPEPTIRPEDADSAYHGNYSSTTSNQYPVPPFQIYIETREYDADYVPPEPTIRPEDIPNIVIQ